MEFRVPTYWQPPAKGHEQMWFWHTCYANSLRDVFEAS